MRYPRAFTALLGLLTLTIAVALGTATPAYAQRQLGAIQGTITDQTGGVLPGVTVTATNKSTGEVRPTTSNEVGIYRLQSLDPGTYDVIAELSGFGRGGRADVVVSVGASVGVNLAMSAGAVSETVQVRGVSPDIQTEKADLSSVVERQRIVDLPIAGRNPLTLATLQPGILGLPGGTDFLAQEQGMGFNASGQRTGANNAMVDGLSINGGPWSGSVLIVPNTEAVQEFQVVANNPSAEFGRNSGAAVSLVTRGGTNELRGSAFTFYRNNDMRAKTYFETLNNAQKADFNKHDFGGSFGGPIRRDNSFFFASYEGVREDSGTGAQYTVETEQFRDFVMRTRPNSNAAYLLDTYRPPVYPTENLRDLGSPARGVRVIGPPDGIPDVGTINYAIVNHREGHQFNGRVDQVFRGGNDKLRGSYYMTRITPEYTYLRPEFNHPYPHRNQFFSLGHTRIISNRTLNELSFGWVRMHGEAGDPTPDAPTISIQGGVNGFGVEFWHPIQFTQNNFEIKEALTTQRGRHNLRFGAEVRLSIDNSELHHWERPNYDFQTPLGVTQNTGLLDFADDEAFSERRGVDPTTGLPTLAVGEYRGREFALFAQDTWKVRSNVTLNLGLRLPLRRRPPRRFPQPPQPELRRRRSGREPDRVELSRHDAAGEPPVQPRLQLPGGVHAWPGQGLSGRRRGGDGPRARLRQRQLRHPSQARAEHHLPDPVRAGQRVAEEHHRRLAAEHHHDLAVGLAVHRHVRRGVPDVRLQRRRQQRRSREPAELWNESPGHLRRGVAGRGLERRGLPAAAPRDARHAAP
jgi:Carboxypeptidase regulatory-like domain